MGKFNPEQLTGDALKEITLPEPRPRRTGLASHRVILGGWCLADAGLRNHMERLSRDELYGQIGAMINDGRAYVVKVLPSRDEPDFTVTPPGPWPADRRVTREAVVALLRSNDAEVGELVAELPPGVVPGDDGLVVLDDDRAFRRARGLWKRVR